MSLFALIPAAGTGSRMRGGGAKQFQRLAGKPMLWHAVRALDSAAVEPIFVVLARDDREFRAQDWSAFEGRIEPLYCGGATRAESVHNGLIAAMAGIDADDWVLVHDAARPCLPRADLERLIAECSSDAIGGILALPVAETVKRVAKDEAGVARIAKSEDRSQLWLAQTPQMFRVGLLAQALHAAQGEVTDEASAVEQLGLQPRLVSGSRRNIKVTYAEDLAIAEAILEDAAS
ncbi:MAG TPA: 2-C-methyl-D-erythritol 4-phosphate cytidylyltransferase [Burkholderiales bacterium]|nr:2-C-methyl-D-erythritol 4-phosphate cytidylyltransferase [Burkholderiales bacterium]